MFLKLNRHLFFIRSNKVQLVKNRLPNSDEQQDSESGRSTEDSGAGRRSSSSGERSNVESPEVTTNTRNSSITTTFPPPAMFPLCRDNLHFVQFVNTLKKAQVYLFLINF